MSFPINPNQPPREQSGEDIIREIITRMDNLIARSADSARAEKRQQDLLDQYIEDRRAFHIAQQAMTEHLDRNLAAQLSLGDSIAQLGQMLQEQHESDQSTRELSQQIFDVHNRTLAPLITLANRLSTMRQTCNVPLNWFRGSPAPATIGPPRIVEVDDADGQAPSTATSAPDVEAQPETREATTTDSAAAGSERPPGILSALTQRGKSLFL
jgi:hypothetical protein